MHFKHLSLVWFTSIGLAMCGAERAVGVDIATIRAGLSAREARIASADIEWSATTSFPSTQGAGIQDPFGSGDQIPVKYSAADIAWKGRLVVAQNQIRFEDNAPVWSFPDNGFVQIVGKRAFDGTTERFLSFQANAKVRYVGDLSDNDSFLRKNGAISALIWQFQPLRKGRAFDYFLNGTPTITEALVGGDRLITIEHKSQTYGNSVLITLDPQRDWTIRKVSRLSSTGTTVDQQLTYNQQPDGVWVPSKWTIVSLGKDKSLLNKTTATVTRASINGAIAPGTFVVDFPANCEVRDHRK